MVAKRRRLGTYSSLTLEEIKSKLRAKREVVIDGVQLSYDSDGRLSIDRENLVKFVEKEKNERETIPTERCGEDLRQSRSARKGKGASIAKYYRSRKSNRGNNE